MHIDTTGRLVTFNSHENHALGLVGGEEVWTLDVAAAIRDRADAAARGWQEAGTDERITRPPQAYRSAALWARSVALAMDGVVSLEAAGEELTLANIRHERQFAFL